LKKKNKKFRFLNCVLVAIDLAKGFGRLALGHGDVDAREDERVHFDDRAQDGGEHDLQDLLQRVHDNIERTQARSHHPDDAESYLGKDAAPRASEYQATEEGEDIVAESFATVEAFKRVSPHAFLSKIIVSFQKSFA
jgi:hypothetical protein